VRLDVTLSVAGGDKAQDFTLLPEPTHGDGTTPNYWYAGIGVMISVVLERNLATILLVFPGSPAEQVGLRPHDSILSVDGKPIVNEQGGIRRELLRGPEGTILKVTVQSPGQPPRQVSITRQRIDSALDYGG
jgi:C-terminal processing protease CtpA/Prc